MNKFRYNVKPPQDVKRWMIFINVTMAVGTLVGVIITVLAMLFGYDIVSSTKGAMWIMFGCLVVDVIITSFLLLWGYRKLQQEMAYLKKQESKN